MSAFSYQAIDQQGLLREGVEEADSPRQLRAQLREKNLKPILIEAFEEPSSGVKTALKKPSWLSLLRPASRLKPAAVALFTRQLATLLDSGLPLSEALEACAKQQSKPQQQQLILQVRSHVLEGYSLAGALAQYPHSFDELYRATITAGEQAGYLARVVGRLAEHCENSQENRQELQGALVYPGFLLLVTIAVVALLMVKVVPDMVGMFTRRGQQLPLLTELLISSSDFLVQYGTWMILALIIAFLGWSWFLSHEKNLQAWHRRTLKLPLLGQWQRNADSARFANTLSILVGGGVPLLNALGISREVVINRFLRQRCNTLVERVSEGLSLSQAMLASQVFPPMLVQMVASGEASGKLENMLARAASYQERELSRQVAALSAILPGLMVVIMGIIVGLIVMAILLPIFAQSQLI